MNATDHLYKLLKDNTNIAFAEFLKGYLEDASKYPEQSTLYVEQSRKTQQQLENDYKQATSGWLLPQSIWEQKRQIILAQNRPLRLLQLVQKFVEAQYQNQPGDNMSIKFYNAVRSGKLKQAADLQCEAAQMLSGYLALHCEIPSSMHDFTDWIGHARSFSRDDHNDQTLRGLFGVLSGYDEPYRKARGSLPQNDEIWCVCTCAVTRALGREQVNSQQILQKVCQQLKTEQGIRGEYVAAILESPVAYLDELIQTYNASLKAGMNVQNQLVIQRVVLEQALFFVFSIKQTGFKIAEDVARRVCTIQERIIEIYTKQIIRTLQDTQKAPEQQQTANDLNLIDLQPATELAILNQKLVQMNLKKDLELVPVIALSLQPSQVSSVFVLFSKTVRCNGYFVQLIERSVPAKRELIETKLNVLRSKLQNKLVLSHETNGDENENELVDCDPLTTDLAELRTLLYGGESVMSESLTSVFAIYVVSLVLKQMLSAKTTDASFRVQFLDFLQKAADECKKQQFEVLKVEAEIFERYLALEDAVQSVFGGAVCDCLADAEELIGRAVRYLEEEQKVENIVQIELIVNVHAPQRQNVMRQLVKKLLSATVKRFAQMAHWRGNGLERLEIYRQYVVDSQDMAEVNGIISVM